MEIDEIRAYCISKKATTESFPFDKHTLVFKVMNKMYCLAGLERWERGAKGINVKCDPEKAIQLREQYPNSVMGGYHMSKKNWNTIYCDRDMPSAEIKRWIDHSYELVVAGLTQKDQKILKTL